MQLVIYVGIVTVSASHMGCSSMVNASLGPALVGGGGVGESLGQYDQIKKTTTDM